MLDRMDAVGRQAVRRYLTDEHRAFFPQLPYVFVGSVDAQGQPWASILLGAPGFIDPLDETTVQVRARPLYADPLGTAIHAGSEIALLGVQLHTRRRNRMFGAIASVEPDGFTLGVRQTLGICPQYIQGREPRFTRDPQISCERPIHRSDVLDDAARAIIAREDTYFVASVAPRDGEDAARGADVSHRGGRPGFVRVDDQATLTAPEFVGNYIFNTLGNWQIDDRAGLLFLDFDSGDLLYVAARAEIVWDGLAVRAFAGAQRLVRYHVEQAVRVQGSLPASFSAPEVSPMLARTGSWTEADRTLQAERGRNAWRPFEIVRMEDESAAIRSLYLEPADGRGMATHAAGQFLPIRTTPDGWAAPAMRTYTISNAPGERAYRISVKREGRGGMSDWLHDHAVVGTRVEAQSPRGEFVFDAAPDRAVVMISAGVGITPFIAMLDSLLINEGRSRHHAPIWLLHGARDSASHAFAPYLVRKVAEHANLHAHVRYSRPLAGDVQGVTHDSVGHLDIELLKSVLPFDDYEFYLCGPPALMQRLYDGLVDLGVRDQRIHLEAFGPAQVKRRVLPLRDEHAGEAVVVNFARSNKRALWRPGQGTLLDVAEQAGLAPLSSCRSGVCGTCSTRVLQGRCDYPSPPVHEIAQGEALICMAIPRAGPHNDADEREGVTLDL